MSKLKIWRVTLFSVVTAFSGVSFFVGTGMAYGAVGDSTITKWKDNAKAAYSLSTDDCRPTQVYTIAPALTERGLRGTFYLNPADSNFGWTGFQNIGDVNFDGTLDGYAHLTEQGHELAGHTRYHLSVIPGYPSASSSFASYDAFHADNVFVKQRLEALGGQKIISFAYPYGYYDGPSSAIVGQDYLSGRTTDGQNPINGHFVPNPATPPDMTRLRTFFVEGNLPWNGLNFTTYSGASSAFQLMANDTLAAGGWGIEFFHSTGNDYGSTYFGDFSSVNRDAYYEHLDNIVNKVQSGDLWEDTVGNVSRYIKSRDAASIVKDSISSTAIQFHIDATFVPGAFFDASLIVPITVNTVIPQSWASQLVVTQNGTGLQFKLSVNPLTQAVTASYNVLPDGTAIILSTSGTGGTVPLAGDYDADGDVDADDYNVWLANFGNPVDTPGRGADGNGNGVVDAADYVIWKNQSFGASGAGTVVGNVPEPSSATGLLLLGAFAGLIRPRSIGRLRAA